MVSERDYTVEVREIGKFSEKTRLFGSKFGVGWVVVMREGVNCVGEIDIFSSKSIPRQIPHKHLACWANERTPLCDLLHSTLHSYESKFCGFRPFRADIIGHRGVFSNRTSFLQSSQLAVRGKGQPPKPSQGRC